MKIHIFINAILNTSHAIYKRITVRSFYKTPLFILNILPIIFHPFLLYLNVLNFCILYFVFCIIDTLKKFISNCGLSIGFINKFVYIILTFLFKNLLLCIIRNLCLRVLYNTRKENNDFGETTTT